MSLKILNDFLKKKFNPPSIIFLDMWTPHKCHVNKLMEFLTKTHGRDYL